MRVSDAKPGDRIQTLLTGFLPESPSKYNTVVVLNQIADVSETTKVIRYNGETMYISAKNNCRVVTDDDIREY
jgi:hypothetical protein